MTRSELYQFIADPTKLSEKTLPELQQLVTDFPFFHAARILYLKNLTVADDIRQQSELKKTVIHIPDRMKLYMLIEGNQNQPLSPLQRQETEDLNEVSPDGNLIFEPVSLTPADYTQLLLDDNQTNETSHARLRHQDLIDSFLLSEKTRTNTRNPIKQTKTDDNSDEITQEPDHGEKSLDDSYFTETLANIYIKQKRYDKALEIIKSLSLKYPKKNIYFADQIRFLEKLIIHTKK